VTRFIESPTAHSHRKIGHASTLVELDGKRILTDPLLRRRPYHLWRQAPAPARRC